MQAAARICQKHLSKKQGHMTFREKEIQKQNITQKETPVSKIVLLCRSSLVSLCLAGRAETYSKKGNRRSRAQME